MQPDQLEQFILGQRDEFDGAVPGLKVWGEISKELDRRKKRRLNIWRVCGAAAAVVFLLTCGALIGEHYTEQQYAKASLEQVAPQYAELEKKYQQEINQKYQQLVSYKHAGLVEHDLAQLDEVMAELKEELLVAPRGKELEIAESLLKSYKAKVEILQIVLDRLQTTNPDAQKQELDEEKVSI
jgi:vacuolar-type H+-ATPase subunit I/STV1